ncbi:MAG: histidine ammonia-lyase [Dehalococcoidia bacterium]|nr:histidine ammonia-lyase [Dehalococcoidia bacterium]
MTKGKLDYSEFVDLCRGQRTIKLEERDKERIRQSRKTFERILKSDPHKSYYAINTGVGALLNRRIPRGRMEEFQENLIMSHTCGIGPPLEVEIVKGMMLHMILNLKKGYCGIRLPTLELMVEMFNRNIIPVVPAKGSLGASGDLVPQAHIALALIGRDPQQVLRAAGLEPAELQIGEAIALLNGTSFMTSCLAFLVLQSDNLIRTADIAAAMTIEALGCSTKSFGPELQELRPHPGQIATAHYLNRLLPKTKGGRKSAYPLQDAYSLRCIPQVHGAFRDTLSWARAVVDIEINSFGGNPWISTKGEKSEICQGSGNFHGQILAHAADSLSVALCSISGISERRIDKLVSRGTNDLPLFLARNQGLNTGLMITQYTAAALVSENKTLAHPASVDSIPVSAGQEDFVSMGAWAVRKAQEICRNTEYVIAIEILCAAQALDFGEPLPEESRMAKIHEIVRTRVAHFERSRVLAEDIEELYGLVHNGRLVEEAGCYEKDN